MFPAGLMWSVVTESPSLSSTRGTGDVGDRGRLGGHAVEVGGLAHVGGGSSHSKICPRGWAAPATLVAGEHVGVAALEHLGADRAADDLLDLLGGRPDVRQEDVVAVGILAERLGGRSMSIVPASA
jgi:hypothetical protein